MLDPVMGVIWYLLLSCLGIAFTDAQDCPKPVLDAGRVVADEKDSYAVDETATVSCADGYIVAADAEATQELTCAAEGWPEVTLVCNAQDCPKPVVDAGKALKDGKETYTSGTTATVVCAEGYRAPVKSQVTCTATTWTVATLQCEVVMCTQPPLIANGTFNPKKDNYAYKETITYSCDAKLELKGSKSRTCSGDGTFVPEAPKCKGNLHAVPLGITLGISGTVLFLQIYWM